MTLEQPETQALHRVVQRVRPDIAADCHEFGRQPKSWMERGWAKWPDITMDRLNNPLIDRDLRDAGDRWIASAAAAMESSGHRFARYWVGGVPPHDEQRHSAPDIDSAMNAVGTYGGLSFIIEAAASRGEEGRAQELGKRVDAYLVLLRLLIAGDGHEAEDREAIRRARARALPPFLPVNYLWVNPTGKVTAFPVLEFESGRTIEVATANMMTEIVIKKSVKTPLAYAVLPPAAVELGTLLDRHSVPYETLARPRSVRAESCTLERVEEEFDAVYSRYAGRQIVRAIDPAPRELPAGSLWVPLDGEAAVRASLLLEPQAMYGLYQYPHLRKLVAWSGALPVLRILP